MRAGVAVIGGGAFGAWTAWHLRRAGVSVLLLDAYGPASGRASSGGESRIIRAAYGQAEIYSRWSARAMELWREWTRAAGPDLLHRTGALWISRPGDTFVPDSAAAMERCGLRFDTLSFAEIRTRFPQFSLPEDSWAIYEPDAGALMARRSVQTLVREMVRDGLQYEQRRVEVRGGVVRTDAGETVAADQYVFACGPWLGKVFPHLLSSRIRPSRQEVFFFGSPAGEARFAPPHMPCWGDVTRGYYGIPDLEHRGFKIAYDPHGEAIDPDLDSRLATEERVAHARAYLAERFPALAEAPLLEARVCQYENTGNGDYLLDRHPEDARFWLAGGGSGHGFKHGPAVGEYMAGLLRGTVAPDPRFSLAAKPEGRGDFHGNFQQR